MSAATVSAATVRAAEMGAAGHRPWTAVILAGGRSTRFGSDKLLAPLGANRLIDLVIDGIPGNIPIVLVGPDPGGIRRAVRYVREKPAYGGPVAAIAAALPLVDTPCVGILAGDMPAAALRLGELVDQLPEDVDALVPIDAEGRVQVLCGAYRVQALAAVIDAAGSPAGLAMRAIAERLQVRTITWPQAWVGDVDVPEDLAEVARSLGEDVLAIESDDRVGDEHGEAADRQG